jgi:hypothetical protein
MHTSLFLFSFLRQHFGHFRSHKGPARFSYFYFLIAVICCAGGANNRDQPASVTRGSKSYCLNQTLGCWHPSRRPGRIAEEEVCSVLWRNKVLIIWAAGTTVCVCNEC